MPGVLIVEAMARACRCACIQFRNAGQFSLFYEHRKGEVQKTCCASGDQIKLEIKVLQQRGNVWRFSGHALVDEKVVSESEFTAMVMAKEK